MNTIPTIFNERKVPHTIVGGTVKKSDEDQSAFTVILLNRSGRYYRSAVFQNLELIFDEQPEFVCVFGGVSSELLLR